MRSRIPNLIGETIEHKIYDILQEYFDSRKMSAVVIHGHKLMILDDLNKPPNQVREKDFLILSKDHSVIINIEAKPSYAKSNIKSVGNQLENTKEALRKYFGGEVDENWKIVRMVFFERLNDEVDLVDCDHCSTYIVNENTLASKLDKIFQLQRRDPKFDTIVKYLLFFTTFNPVPTSSAMIKLVKENIERASKAEVISLWCNLTTMQLSLIESAILRAILTSAYSTGKTMMLSTKALRLAQDGFLVLFLLSFTEIEETLLLLDLKTRFKDEPNIKLIAFPNKDLQKLEEIIADHPEHHVMIDEFIFYGNDPGHSNESPAEGYYQNNEFVENCRAWFQRISSLVSSCRFLWIAMAGVYNRCNWAGAIEALAIDHWCFPEMKYPLRNSQKIVEFCQNIDNHNFGNDMLRKTQATSRVLEIPTNLTVGLEVIKCKEHKLRPALEEAFRHCKLERRVLIILASDIAQMAGIQGICVKFKS